MTQKASLSLLFHNLGRPAPLKPCESPSTFSNRLYILHWMVVRIYSMSVNTRYDNGML